MKMGRRSKIIGEKRARRWKWWWPYQPHPGTWSDRCGCSLPGL